MAIVVTAADKTGAEGTCARKRTQPFQVKLYDAALSVVATQVTTPVGSLWSVTWAVPLVPGDYKVVAGTGSLEFTVVAPPPPSRLFPSSPLYAPVPTNPALHPMSPTWVQNWMGQGPWGGAKCGNELGPDDWGRPYYEAVSTDPAYTVIQGDTGGYVDPMSQGDTIHVPVGARPAAGASSQQKDGAVTIRQPDGWVYSMWRSRDPVNGRCAQCAVIDGRGNGVPGGGYAGIGQAKLGTRQGQVMYDELQTGLIPHALVMEVNKWHGRVYPSWPGDGKVRGGEVSDPSYAPQGAHFWLAYTPQEIEALNVPWWKKTILHAMATYGLYIYDNGGAAHALDFESAIPWIVNGKPNKWVEFCKANPSSHIQVGAQGVYTFNIESGVDWSRLRVLQPGP